MRVAKLVGGIVMAVWAVGTMLTGSAGEGLVPAASEVRKDRPRLLVRPKETPAAVSVEQLRKIPRDAEFGQMLDQLRKCGGAAPSALAWLLTGEQADAEKALAALRDWKLPDKPGDPFSVYFGCRDLALAYDWLCGHPAFTAELKAQVRDKVRPLAEIGVKSGDDHVFHNYVWMFNSGAMLWALAMLGDDPKAEAMYATLRARFNERLFPAMQYLEGSPADAQGYWSLYCLAPGVQVLLAAQSASETDLAAAVKAQQGDWLNRQLENLVHVTAPDLRYLGWGDMQDGGDGGVAHEMAGNIEAMTWATKSPAGAWFSKWLAGKRGTKRFYGETAMGYFLYTRFLATAPAKPALDFLAGGKHGGQFLMRSGWADGDTAVGFRCNDHYTGHNHFDAGSFVIYRNGPLALDAGTYKNVGGAQVKTENHNTLLFGGQGQRPVRNNYTVSVESYRKALAPGPKSFETGNLLLGDSKPGWAAAAGEFGQAYPAETVGRCIRQLLFVRPGTLLVVDRLEGPAGKELPEVKWLLHLPASPDVAEGSVLARAAGSFLRCRSLVLGGVRPLVEPGANSLLAGGKKGGPSFRVAFAYPGKAKLVLVHAIEVGDGEPGAPAEIRAEARDSGVEVTVGGKRFLLSASEPFTVSEAK